MKHYLTWKNQLLKSSNSISGKGSKGQIARNLFQYKYKYYNNIIQKHIENGFYFPSVNLRNSEFYYLGKYFLSKLFSDNMSTSSKNNLNKLFSKKSKRGINVNRYNYINISNAVPATYYCLNLMRYLPLVADSAHNFSSSNVVFYENKDGNTLDLINFGIFDLISNTRSDSNVLYYYSHSSDSSKVLPEFLSDNTSLSFVYSKSLAEYQNKSMLSRISDFVDILTGRHLFLSEYFYNYLNSDVGSSDISFCSDIVYNDFVDVSSLSDANDLDLECTYLLSHLNDQLSSGIRITLRSRYNNTLAWLAEMKLKNEIETKFKAAEAKILDDFDNHRIGEKKKQRLLLALYNKHKKEELEREEAKKKSQMPIIRMSNYSNLDSSLDDINEALLRKITSNVSNKSFVKDVYQYEYENLSDISNNISLFNADDDNVVSISKSSESSSDNLDKVNHYDSSLNIINEIAKNKLFRKNKSIFDQQRSVRLMNCLNDLLNYSESHSLNIEHPSDFSAEIHLSKQYNFLKSLFTSYKASNKFPVQYVSHLNSFNSTKKLGAKIDKHIISMYRKKNIHVQLIAPTVKGLFYYPNINLHDNKFNYYMYWDINCLYYKFIGLLIKHGKRHKAEFILNDSFSFIKNLSLCNPLYIFMKALYNGQTFFEFTKQKKQTKSLLIPRYTPLNKRIKISMRTIAQNIRSGDVLRKTMKAKKYKVNTSYLLSNIFISYFFKIGKVKNDLITNVTNAYKQKHLLKKNSGTFVYNRLLKFLAFRKIRGYHISK